MRAGVLARPSYASTSVSRTATGSCASTAHRAGPGRPRRRAGRRSREPAGGAGRDAVRPAQSQRLSPARPGRPSVRRRSRSAASCSRDPVRRGSRRSAERAASAPLDREHVADVRREVRRDRGQVGVGQVGEARCRATSQPRDAGDRPPRAPRGTATPRADQPLGDVGGEREPVGRGAPPSGRCRTRSVATMPGHRGQHQQQGVDGVEDRLLVLLQVAVVRERQALERREQRR